METKVLVLLSVYHGKHVSRVTTFYLKLIDLAWISDAILMGIEDIKVLRAMYTPERNW